MNDIDYARIHLNVAVQVWQDSPRWNALFPNYDHYCALRVEAEALAYDLAVAAHFKGGVYLTTDTRSRDDRVYDALKAV